MPGKGFLTFICKKPHLELTARPISEGNPKEKAINLRSSLFTSARKDIFVGFFHS